MSIARHLRGLLAVLIVTGAAAGLAGCGARSGSAADTDAPIVTIETGSLVGVRDNDLIVFRNIPYAAAPVGGLRWRPPGPVIGWDGIRDATAFGPSCVQQAIPATSIYHDPPLAMSEDCLSLNIWAPETTDNAAVIVWIHGGSLRIGGAAQAMYDGSVYADRGIVFVSINYRLGALGWMAHPALSAESENGVSGNYGLLDQIAALHWVQDNIAAFGGDPDNVTVMGESAGALSVTYLLTSPLSEGLFDRAIAESTNLRAFPALDEPAFGLPSAESTGEQVAAALGGLSLVSLRAMDAEEFTNATAAIGFGSQGTIDGWALPDQIIDVLGRNEQHPVPLLVGFNSDEVRTQRGLLPPTPATPEAYEALIRCGYGDAAEAFLDVYPSTNPEQSNLNAFRDTVYGWAGERLARAQADLGVPSYLYIFDHCYPAAEARDICGFHASELPFVFGQVGAQAALTPNWPAPNGDTSKAVSDAMIDYWASFAATGHPVSASGPAWSAYADNEAYLHIADTPIPARNPVPGMYEMYTGWVARRRAQEEQWFLQVGVNAPQTCTSDD